MDPALPGFIGLLILLVLSFFLTAAYAALTNARRQMLREQAEKGNRQAQIAVTLAEDSSRVISTFGVSDILVHFLIASLAISLFLSPLATWLGERLPLIGWGNLALGYLIIAIPAALVVYILTEMLPDLLVAADPDRWAMRLATPALWIITLLQPLVAVLGALRRGIALPLGLEREGATITEEEIMTLVDAGEEEGSIQLGEKEMIYSIFQLDDTLAREIMVPRIDIVAVESVTSLDEARDIIIQAGHSRIPVYDGSLDQIVGLLYAKDLLSIDAEGSKPKALKSMLRPALFVPETKRVPDLLHELRNSKVHLAVIIDEYGGTAGLVTIEDIMEEIVGEILDEYDSAEEAPYETISPDEFLFDARINLDDFNRVMESQLPDEMADTLAGFIYGELGKVPDAGEIVTAGSLQLEVASVVDRRIRKVHVTRLADHEEVDVKKNGRDSALNGNSNGR